MLLVQILTHDSYGQCQLTFKEFKNINGHYIDEVVQNEVVSCGEMQKALLCSSEFPGFVVFLPGFKKDYILFEL